MAFPLRQDDHYDVSVILPPIDIRISSGKGHNRMTYAGQGPGPADAGESRHLRRPRRDARNEIRQTDMGEERGDAITAGLENAMSRPRAEDPIQREPVQLTRT